MKQIIDGKEISTASIYDPNNGLVAQIDGATRAQSIIDYAHHEIHSGSHYFICDYMLNQASGAIIDLVFTVPNETKWPHLTFDFSSSNGATLEIYEGASSIVGGTSVTPQNNNRNVSNNSNITIISNPTSITAGTRIAGFLAGGARTSGFNTREKENILKQNTTYLLRITSLAVSNDIGYCGEWYEHINQA